MTTIEIDWTRCEAHGLCSRLLPDTVTLDEWGYPLFADTSLADRAAVKAARTAASVCPSLALRLQ